MMGLLLGAVGLLTACTREAAEETGGDEDCLQVVSYLPAFGEMGGTRSEAPMPFADFYPEMEAGKSAIALWMTPDDTRRWGTAAYEGNGQWESLVPVKKKNYSYYLYGFMPVAAVSNASVSPRADGYQAGAVLTLEGMDAAMTADPCVLVGVQQTTGVDGEQAIRRGNFTYLGKGKGENFARLLFDHLYASVCFRLKVQNTYDALRTIKLKSLGLKTSGAGAVTVNVTLTANGNEADPITSVSYTGSGEGTVFDIWKNAEGLTLSTEPEDIEACFAPSVGNGLTLVSTYDVYDKKGTLMRENCTAENDISSRVQGIGRGQQVVLTLTINPTYLYMLSEPDLNNPTFTMDE